MEEKDERLEEEEQGKENQEVRKEEIQEDLRKEDEILNLQTYPEEKRDCCEGNFWDNVVSFTQGMLAPPIGIVWMVLVVIVGAAFFFLLIGAVPLRPQSEKEKWLNLSIHGLNILFTYAAIANFPGRFRTLLRLMRIKGTVGINYDRLPSLLIFDHIPWSDRFNIVIILILNCVFQFINQLFRIKYYSFELSNQGIAILWVNLFFVSSFVCAIWAPIYQWREEQKIRREGRAPPGEELDPLQRFTGKEEYTLRDLWDAAWAFVTTNPPENENEIENCERNPIPQVELDEEVVLEMKEIPSIGDEKEELEQNQKSFENVEI